MVFKIIQTSDIEPLIERVFTMLCTYIACHPDSNNLHKKWTQLHKLLLNWINEFYNQP